MDGLVFDTKRVETSETVVPKAVQCAPKSEVRNEHLFPKEVPAMTEGVREVATANFDHEDGGIGPVCYVAELFRHAGLHESKPWRRALLGWSDEESSCKPDVWPQPIGIEPTGLNHRVPE